MPCLGFLVRRISKQTFFHRLSAWGESVYYFKSILKNRKNMEKGNCYSEQIVDIDDPEVQADPETNKRKMRLGTHRYRNFQNSSRSERVPAIIGWRRRFVQVVSNVVRKFRYKRRD
ncbi:hypothetical protein CDAR_507641 [Caerostris darwini]|uniref:Uncharacterized protein n=1 Tax=Caerostris darwini TaxID=1538125 RepID=A0AAV4VIE6_9ARAC|nr:hypothetical protein CDAR_507641 [Caerostris darwini]